MNKVILSALVVLLATVTISEGRTRRSLGVELHCRCIQKERRPIFRQIEKYELIAANSHCEETELIGTITNTGEEVCLDPKAPWVKKVIEQILKNKRR
ncbi:interleukin-8 isoform X2 [Stigmatopora argus]